MGSLFLALFTACTLTLNELKAILRASAQAGQNGAVKKASVESTAQDDDFQVAKRRNNNSRTDNNSNKPVPTSANVKLPPKAVLTLRFFAPLRTTDMGTETTEAENALPEQEAPRKPRRPPPIMITSTTNLIRLQSYLKDHVKGDYEFRNTGIGTVS
jgi:hypothetical protein